MAFTWGKIEDIAAAVNSGKTSAVDQVKVALKQIAETNPDHNAVLSVLEESALKRAEEIDSKIKSEGSAGRLAGVPFLAKDNYLTFNTTTTASSNILKDFEAPYQSEAIDKLESEGAILVGKTNMDAFAHGGSTENSDFEPTKNPHDLNRVPGGSSGGSAAAVALGMTPFALGSDTGGSIRQPASFNGVVGLKPTYGLVSRFGVIAMASSTDVLGPLATRVEDAALIFDVIAGPSDRDSTLIERDSSVYTKLDTTLKGLKVGVINDQLTEDVDSEVVNSVKAAAELMKEAGASVEDVSIDNIEAALAVYYIVVPAEIASNLARYDGVKFGHSADQHDLEANYLTSRADGFNEENKRRILIGNYVLSSGYYDAFYKKAQQVRTLIIESYQKAFEEYDVLIGPVAPTQAFELGANTSDPLKMYLEDVMTVPVSICGLPAVSVPIEPANGLPIGLQITGPQRGDRKVLSVAAEIEKLISKEGK